MADTLQQYKCPCCGGAIEFNSDLQKMKCPYCDTEFEMDTLKGYDEELKQDGEEKLDWDVRDARDWESGEENGIRVYVCQSCGGEILSDENTAATSCPYCGNAVVMMGNLSGSLKPDVVIPFQLDKQAAKEGFKKHLLGKRLLPKAFKSDAFLDEVKGVYVPFWLYDADVNAHFRFRTTKVRFWSDSKYNYTETRHYSVVRGGGIGFDRVPVDGSSKMDDTLMESLEPFDYNQAVDFQTAYLAGFFADKYNMTAEQMAPRADQRIKTSTETAFRDTVVGYNTVMTENRSMSLYNTKAHYALYPVWLLTAKWKDEDYLFAMNGQTGKFVGNLPIDWGAFWAWFLGLTGAITVGMYLVLWFIGLL